MSSLSRHLFRLGYRAQCWQEGAVAGSASDGDRLLVGWQRQGPRAFRQTVLGEVSEAGIAVERPAAAGDDPQPYWVQLFGR